MRRSLGAMVVGFACVGGCAASGPSTSPAPLAERPAPPAGPADARTAGERAIVASAAPEVSDVIARVGTRTITKDQLLAPMLEEHGLSFLLHLVQLDLARQAAAQQKIEVTAADIKEERDLTFKRMLAEGHAELRQKLQEAIEKKDNAAVEQIKAQLEIDPEAALDAYLAQRYSITREYVSKGEFNLTLETNAYLRKIAEATPAVKNVVTDAMVRKAFGAQFGEKVVIRHIQANNLQGITEARRRLQAGENFAEVAKAVSTNPTTAPTGGAVRPFTFNDPDIRPVLKEAAFDLADGEVSETIEADNAFHILKLERRIEPKVVKFENVKENLRASLNDQVLQAAVAQLRDKVARQARANLRIEHPELKEQFEKRQEAQRIRNQQQLDEQLKLDRAANAPPGADPAAGPGDLPQPGGDPTGTPAPDETTPNETTPGAATPGAANTGTGPAAPRSGSPAGTAAPAAPGARAKPKATGPARAPASAPPARQSSPAENDDE